ncbi:MAG: ATP synthase subunit I, partial [Pseudomonadota bacterium]
VLTQSVIVLLLAVVFFLISGHRASLAVICGGLVNILPGYFYAARLFANVSPHAIMRIMVIFYVGEVLKLIISVGLFIILLSVFKFPLLPYFLGYLVAALAFCVAPLWLMNQANKGC